MASEAITLSPEVRARGGRDYTLPCIASSPALIHFHAQLPDDLRPARHVLADYFCDSLRRARERLEARREHPLAHQRICRDSCELAIQSGDRVARRARGSEGRIPLGPVDAVVAGLRHARPLPRQLVAPPPHEAD